MICKKGKDNLLFYIDSNTVDIESMARRIVIAMIDINITKNLVVRRSSLASNCLYVRNGINTNINTYLNASARGLKPIMYFGLPS